MGPRLLGLAWAGTAKALRQTDEHMPGPSNSTHRHRLGLVPQLPLNQKAPGSMGGDRSSGMSSDPDLMASSRSSSGLARSLYELAAALSILLFQKRRPGVQSLEEKKIGGLTSRGPGAG